MAAQGLVPIVLVLSQVLQGSPEKVNSHTTAPSLTPILPAPRHSSRRQNRLILQSPDFCDALGRELVLSGCGLGGLAFRTASASGAFASPSMQSFATPVAPSIQVLAANPEVALRLLKARARRDHRQIDTRDFFNGTSLPTADHVSSPTTPGNVVVNVSNYWTLKTAKVLQAFNSRPKIAQGERRVKDAVQRSNRLVFWESDGSILRYNQYLMHEVIEESGKRTCLFCGKERAAKGCSCVICGEYFCSRECFMDFHRRGVEFRGVENGDEESGRQSTSVLAGGASATTSGPSGGASTGISSGAAGGGTVGSIEFNLDQADDEAILAPMRLSSNVAHAANALTLLASNSQR